MHSVDDEMDVIMPGITMHAPDRRAVPEAERLHHVPAAAIGLRGRWMFPLPPVQCHVVDGIFPESTATPAAAHAGLENCGDILDIAHRIFCVRLPRLFQIHLAGLGRLTGQLGDGAIGAQNVAQHRTKSPAARAVTQSDDLGEHFGSCPYRRSDFAMLSGSVTSAHQRLRPSGPAQSLSFG